MAGKTSIADELVFPSQTGTVIKPDNIVPQLHGTRTGESVLDVSASMTYATPSEVC